MSSTDKDEKITLRQRLIDLGMTGHVEQQQVIDVFKEWLEQKRKEKVALNQVSWHERANQTHHQVQFIDELLGELTV